MKLPGQLDFGVQRLARPPVAASNAKAVAEQNASLAWGEAFATAGKTFATVAAAEGQADANLTLSERVAMDKKSAAELDAYLESTPVIDLSQETVPRDVRLIAENYADMNKITSGFIPTYDVVIDATEAHYARTRSESAEALAAKDASDATQGQYNQAMDDVWAKGAASAVNTHVIQRLEALGARADTQLNQAIASLDEGAAMRVIVEAEQTGVWTPDVAGAKMAALGSSIDTVQAHDMYMSADTQGEIDEADDFTDMSRVTPEKRITLRNLSNQRQENMFAIDSRRQDVNYGNAQAELIKGTLTKLKIADMVTRQDITGSHANTLRNALDKPAPAISDPRVVDRLTGQITALRFRDEGDPPITESANELRQSLFAQYTGTTKNGDIVAKSLTGGDFSDMMTLLDETENTALGKGSQRYTIATKTIKSLTQYSDNIAKIIEGTYPAGLAYSAFTLALQDHVNTEGADAKPEEFIARNAHRFTAEVYSEALHERLSIQYPQYRPQIMNLLSTDKGGTDPLEPANSVGSVLNAAKMDMLNGVIEPSDWENIRRSLQYLTFGTESAVMTRPATDPGTADMAGGN